MAEVGAGFAAFGSFVADGEEAAAADVVVDEVAGEVADPLASAAFCSGDLISTAFNSIVACGRLGSPWRSGSFLESSRELDI